MNQTLLIIAKELRQEMNFISSPVLKKRLRAWAERIEIEAKPEKRIEPGVPLKPDPGYPHTRGGTWKKK